MSEVRGHMNSHQEGQFVARAPRFPSHALVDVRLSRWNPFAKASAVLIDMSVTGFKIQFVEKVQLRMGMKIQIGVPLEPFGLTASGRLSLKGEVKWFDEKMMRAGGMFVQSADHDRLMIERIIASVISRQH